MLEVFFTLILLSNFLLLFLLCLLPFHGRAMSESNDYEADVTDDETYHVDESGEAESKSNERFLIKIMFEETETVKEWLVPIINVFVDMNEVRDRIIKHLGLPAYSELNLRFHLDDIMTQKTEILKIYIRIMNNATAKQVGGAGRSPVPKGPKKFPEPICTSKPANTSAPPESDFDDWLIT